VDDLLLEGAVKAFDDAVGFGFADESETGREAVEAALALEVVGEILAAVIVAQFDALGGLGRGGAEDPRNGLGDRLVGGEAVANFADMVPEALGIPVFERGEAPQPAVRGGLDFRTVDGPAHVGRVGDDASVVRFGRHGGRAVRREQVMLANQAQDAVATDAVAGEVTQAAEDFTMAFPGEMRG
jgi:hypothetical protein